MRRRTLLTTGLTAGLTAVAGCSDVFETRPADSPGQGPMGDRSQFVEDPPDAVYIPTHMEGMQMEGMGTAGDYGIAVSYSFPHPFWIMTGQNRERVTVREEDSVHLMVSLWDDETRMVVPSGDVSIEISQDGETVVSKSPWPMLSQNMGFHFGDNVALGGEGTYTVDVDIGPMSTRRTGAFRDRFDSSVSASFELEFSRSALEDLMYQQLDRAGERGAMEPMDMSMPITQLPPAGETPGQVLGEATSGDASFVVTALEDPPAGIDAEGQYLAVSARTPYNRYPLPFMALSATLTRDGESVFDGNCLPTFDSDLNYHYGAVVDSVEAGDDLTVSVGAPPQLSRHEGYETAFLEMADMELTLSE